ncbi:uncharacterized protein UTRI_02425 [Ustilago trichophora]|uniref:CRD1 - cardiolipin synthase n=1 Tax=Ustilago trichophora TaxID=86804 RepID=A0A5C3EAE3_9BASI|nr:uncharacterized protein UTRI_02425 [Ustilago trichophora]
MVFNVGLIGCLSLVDASSLKIFLAISSRDTLKANLSCHAAGTTRTFSSTPLNRTQPSSASASSTPPPPSSPPRQPLSEDILTIPNLLTMLRLALTPYIGYLVATHNFVPACTLLFIASITDLLDGWIARKTGKYTVFGSIADPAADKALVTTMVISLALSGMLPWTVATIILGRDVALVISAFVISTPTSSTTTSEATVPEVVEETRQP